MRGEYFSVFLSNLTSQPRSMQKADLDEDDGALFFVEGGRVGGGSVWDPSCVDEVR